MHSMYDFTIPPLERGLRVLVDYMDLARSFADLRGMSHSQIIGARLAPDMMSLASQVQRASDNAKNGVSRLVGITAPLFPDNETTFDELRKRAVKTISFLQTIHVEQFEGSEDRTVSLAFRSISETMSGYTYLTRFLLPNFYFHVSTAHGILRSVGLEVGKKDYFGRD